jgi:hypothetical protein
VVWRRLRILRNVATALSVVLCVAVAVLWRASYSASVPLWINANPSPPRFLSVEHGEITYGRTIIRSNGVEPIFIYDYPFRTRCLTVLALAAVIPLGRIARPLARSGVAFYNRHFGPRPGRCAKCNYDLRATPDRCPECGTVPTVKAPSPGGSAG